MSSDPPPLSELLQHRAFLERFARRLARDASVADEVVQETWLEALERPPPHRGNLRAWLGRVARNVFLQRKRSRDSAPSFEILEDEPIDEAGKALEREAIARAIGAELLALPEPYRGVLILRYYQDRTPTEIARELDRPLNTVTSQLGRGLRLLQERLDRSHPGGRSQWLRALLCLVPRAPRTASGTPLPHTLRGLRATALLGALVASVALFVAVLALRTPARSIEPEGSAAAIDAASEARDPADAREELELAAAADARESHPAPEPSASARAVVARLFVEVVSVDGRPIAGALVQMAERGDSPAGSQPMLTYRGDSWTDASGRVEIPVTDENRVKQSVQDDADVLSVTAQADGFETSGSYGMRFPEEGGTESVTIRMKPGSVSVRGTVTDLAGLPLENATVEIGRPKHNRIELGAGRYRLESPITTITGADGRFHRPGVPAGTVEIFVERPGFVPHVTTMTLSDPSETPHDVVLHRGASLVGRVTTEDGLPADGAHVWVEFLPHGPKRVKQWAFAGPDGTFGIQGIEPGKTWLFAEHAGLAGRAAVSLATFATGETRTWDPVLRELPPLRLRLQREDGSPLAGAIVGVHSTEMNEAWQRFLAAGPDGRVRFDAVPDTAITASVFLAPADLDRGAPPCHAWSDLQRRPDEQVLTLPQQNLGRGGLRGVLVDHEGEPFPDAMLQLRLPGQPFFYGTRVDPETGAFELERLTTQSYELIAWAAGFGTERLDTLEVFDGDVFELGEIRLSRPVPWSAPWPTPETTAGDAYELVKLDDVGERTKRWMIASGTLPPPSSFTLIPGRYAWLVYRSGELLRSDACDVR